MNHKMAYYVKLNSSNVVEKIYNIDSDLITDVDGTEKDSLAKEYLNLRYGFHPRWVRTYPDLSQRKNFAAVGYTYDNTRDAFIPPKPHESWTLNETTCLWEAPSAMPDDGKQYDWNEDSQSWTAISPDETLPDYSVHP
tara:strand:+ start:1366 stop:1779 length:414 start_codon:yes stop_codon:yes gene_type:complete